MGSPVVAAAVVAAPQGQVPARTRPGPGGGAVYGAAGPHRRSPLPPCSLPGIGDAGGGGAWQSGALRPQLGGPRCEEKVLRFPVVRELCCCSSCSSGNRWLALVI